MQIIRSLAVVAFFVSSALAAQECREYAVEVVEFPPLAQEPNTLLPAGYDHVYCVVAPERRAEHLAAIGKEAEGCTVFEGTDAISGWVALPCLPATVRLNEAARQITVQTFPVTETQRSNP